MGFFEKVWSWIKSLFGGIDNWMIKTFKFDVITLDLYEKLIVPLPEWVKWLGVVGIAILLVLGVISLIKKSIKLVIVIAVILGIILLITWL